MITKVAVCMPMRPDERPLMGAAASFYAPVLRDSSTAFSNQTAKSSLLTHSFNHLWAETLNRRQSQGFTHFAMIHDDIVTERGWVDILLDEMHATGAALISVVVPQRTPRGHTSTALESGDPWKPKVFTLREVYEKPMTWTEPGLLVNTGLMLVKLTGDHLNPMPFFRQTDQVILNPRGLWEAQCIPEDWDFSRQIRDRGGAVWATRRVKCHHGTPACTNTKVWGDAPKDFVQVTQEQKP